MSLPISGLIVIEEPERSNANTAAETGEPERIV